MQIESGKCVCNECLNIGKRGCLFIRWGIKRESSSNLMRYHKEEEKRWGTMSWKRVRMMMRSLLRHHNNFFSVCEQIYSPIGGAGAESVSCSMSFIPFFLSRTPVQCSPTTTTWYSAPEWPLHLWCSTSSACPRPPPAVRGTRRAPTCGRSSAPAGRSGWLACRRACWSWCGSSTDSSSHRWWLFVIQYSPPSPLMSQLLLPLLRVSSKAWKA